MSDFSILTKNFSDIYDITLTSTTLKKKPDFSNPIWSKDEVNGSFKLSLSNIEDPDNAITSYTYSVYNYNLDGTVGAKAVTDITKSDATPIQVMVGTSGGLELSKKYVYKAVIEYYDNEKYLELVTSYSDKFSMDEEAFVTLIPDDETMENNRTSYNRIGGTIYLTDNSCLIKMQSRTDEGCPGISNVDIQIMIDNPNQHNIDDPNWEENNQKYIFKTIKNAEFTYDNEGRLQYSLDVPGLKEHTFYLIRVINNDTESGEPKEIKFSSESATGIWTKKISTFDIVWADGDSNDPNVINAEGRLVANDNGEVSVVESVNSIKRIDVEIYEGNYQSGVFETNELTPIVPTKTFVNTNGFNLKEKFYDKAYNFTNGMFGLTLDDFKDIIDANPESDYYFTLYVKACYDTACNNPISITKDTAIHPYLVNRALFEPDLGEFVITEPVEIPRGDIEYYQNLENEDTTVGFRFTTSFDNQKLLAARYEAKGVRISVYKEDGTKVGFYVIENNSLIPKDKDTYLYRSVNSSNFGDPFEIYLDPDTSGEGNYMHRGSEYYIVYEVETISKSDVTYLPVNRTGKPEKKYSGTYQIVSTRKEEPVINLHIAESTSGSVTYEYDIKDADHALVKEDGTYNLYYDIDGTEYSLPIDLENSSSGEITIPNLNQGDYYAIYTKINLTGNDVKRYPDVSNHTKRLFESEYTLGEDNIRFKVIPSQLTDNKVTIKLLAEQNLLNRVLIYKVYFRANGETILKEFAKLGSCGLNNTDVTCLSVGYDELRAMRSQQIDISIKVAYDTGLTGFDYIGRAEYMILQQHNTGNGLGYYIGFTSGNQPVVLDETYSVPKGYYMVSYVNQQRKDELNYTKIMDAGNVTKRITSLHKALDGDGIVGHTQSGDSVINPKVVRLTDVNVGDGESKNFYFDSYTPTIDVKIPNTSYLINGTSASIRLFGADYNEFCEESSSDNCVNHGVDGAYYIHVDVYERDSNTQVGNYKFKIEDNTKINQKPVIAKLDKLRHSTDYYFNVYVFLNKDGRKEPLQLYDNDLSAKMGDFTAKNYDFTSLTGNDLVQPGSITINSIVKSSVIALRPSANYGDRVLDTKFTLKNYEFNYDLEYVLCDAEASTEVCNNSTLRKTINSASIQGISVADYMDLPDDLDYSKRYVLYLYAIYKSYNDQDVRVLIDTKGDFLDTIEKPTFNIERKKAMFDNGESYIDITVHVDDSDERLIDGKYKVQLPLFGETVSQGNMYVSRDNGLTFEPVDSNTEFSVEDTNLMIRVRGLTANTKYEIIVNGRAYLDDHDQEVEIKLAKDVVIYSADASGTALGETANIEGANGIVTVTLFGGSNADNVTEVYYTIGEWGGYLGLDSEGNAIWKQNAVTQTGHYVLAESNNGFSYNSQTADLQYKIAPVTFANGASCQAVVRFKTSVQDPDTGDIVEKWIPFSDYFVYGETG